MKRITNTVISLAVVMACTSLSPLAYGHGAVSWPVSRQLQCYREGGFWGPLENIPNSGCRAAVAKSEQYPLVQWNEVAANPSPRNDPDAIKKAVPDGLLCAAGDPKKRGLDEPQSAGWKLTPVQAGAKINLTWDASAAHNPARYTVYITKPGVDYQNRALKWEDLTQIATGQMPNAIPASPYPQYKIPVTLPANRTGNAILYSVWQREDAGNEGFFNCSDISFEGGVDPKPPVPGDEWLQEQPFVKPGIPSPDEGDRVRFRLLGGSGSRGLEVVDLSIEITAGNKNNYRWAEELASELNDTQEKYLQVGVKKHGSIQFESGADRIHQNQVWVKDSRYSSSLSVIAADKPGPDADKVWPNGIGTYLAGKTVVKGSDGKKWRCREFPQGGWCNINHPAYEPGGKNMATVASQQAWEPVK